tara:strand:+ start:135 stop:392 length:258 start_codon:yes stop_codon:yes gene_type:complete
MAFKMAGFSAFTKEKILPGEEASIKSAEREEKSQKNWPESGDEGLSYEQMMSSLQKDLADAKANNEQAKIQMILKDIESLKKSKQ